MPKYGDKLAKLVDDINKSIATLEIPIKGVGVVIEWDLDKVPAADANTRELPGGLLAYPAEITLKSVLNIQRRAGEFGASLTEMAINAVTERQADSEEAKPKEDTSQPE